MARVILFLLGEVMSLGFVRVLKAPPVVFSPTAITQFLICSLYQELVFSYSKCSVMAKNTSILLGDYFDQFISSQIETGRFSSASEVVRAALRLFEQEERKKTNLIHELKAGEESGFVAHFDKAAFLKGLHEKRVADGI